MTKNTHRRHAIVNTLLQSISKPIDQKFAIKQVGLILNNVNGDFTTRLPNLSEFHSNVVALPSSVRGVDLDVPLAGIAN